MQGNNEISVKVAIAVGLGVIIACAKLTCVYSGRGAWRC
jgi:hypothetical protein